MVDGAEVRPVPRGADAAEGRWPALPSAARACSSAPWAAMPAAVSESTKAPNRRFLAVSWIPIEAATLATARGAGGARPGIPEAATLGAG